MFDRKVDTVGAAPEPKVTTLQRGVEKSGSLFAYAIAALVIAVILGGTMTYRYVALKTELNQVTQLTDQVQQEYNKLAPTLANVKEVSTIVTALKGAREQKLLYDSMLQALARESLKTVKYKSVNIDQSGKVALSGSVVTYNDFARVVKALRESDGDSSGVTKNIKIDQITQGQSTENAAGPGALITDFTISFNVDTALYKLPALVSSTSDQANPSSDTTSGTTNDSATNVDAPTSDSTGTTDSTTTTTPDAVQSTQPDLLDAFDQSTNQPPQNSSL